MPLYEPVFLARQDLSQAQVDALAVNATEIIETNAGKVTKTESWGLKGLAFKIKRNRKAHFVMLNIEAPAGVVGTPNDVCTRAGASWPKMWRVPVSRLCSSTRAGAKSAGSRA